jgi:RimJ/RimL family protein N-acetyltransferase
MPRRRATTLETPRLVLRDYRPGDVPPLARLLAHPEVCRPSDGTPQALEAAERAARGQRRRPRQWELAVESRRSGHLVGACEVVLRRDGSAMIGYLLGRRFWGRGYGTEIARALMTAALQDPSCRRVEAHVAEGNERSRRVLLKAGFRWTGRERVGGASGSVGRMVEVYTWARPRPAVRRR